MASPSIGATLLERYRIERDAGRTDSGVVFDAVEVTTGRGVALEVATRIDDESSRAELVRDALIAERLEGEHVLRVIDAGMLSDGVPYLVREPWIGRLSDEVVVRGPLPVEEAVGWTLEILEALAEAHAIGMAHGDVRPENAVLARDKDGKPVAKLRWPTARKAKRQVREDVAADIAGAADVLRFLVTGDKNPESDGAKTLPTDIAYAVGKALTKDEGAAFKNVGDLAAAIARHAPAGHKSARNIRHMLSRAGMAPEPPAFVRPTPIVRERRDTPRTAQPKRIARSAIAGVAFVALGTAAAVAFALAGRGEPPPLSPTAMEPVSTTTLTNAEVAAATEMTPPTALSKPEEANALTAPKMLVPVQETIELDDEPTLPPPVTAEPVPKAAEPTAPAETSDPLR